MTSITSGISGRVADAATDQPIPFASVIVSINGVSKGAATTNMDGAFHIKPIEPGFYSLEATCIGYQPAQLKKIDAPLGEIISVPVVMVTINPS